MKVPRSFFLSLIVAAALVAAVPATATAAVWKHDGVNLGKHVTINLSGAEAFAKTGVDGVIDCEVSATLTTEGGSSGKITKYTLFGCFGTGALAKCVPLALEAKGLPWTVDVNTADLTLTSMRIRRTFVGSCPFTEADATMNPTLTLDNASAISEMEFLADNGTYLSAGALWVDPPNDGTYGIG